MSLSGLNVLVTGADGFIGSHLAERLVVEGCTVRALSQYNSFGSHGWLDHSRRDMRDAMDLHLGDIRDPGLMVELSRGIDLIFHLAALIAIPYSYQAPESFVDTNVRGTMNVLQAARTNGARVVSTSTSEVYGTPEAVPITTRHPMRAQSPYAATKVAADQLCLAWASSFDVDVVILRPFNTYGPRQSMRAVIPTILTQMIADTREIRLGSVHTRRDFTYVDDTVDGFVKMAIAQTVPGDTVQLGTGQSVSVAQVVEVCRQITGCTAPVVTDSTRIRPEASEVQVLLSDPSEAMDRIGWVPQHSLAVGLAETARWLTEFAPTESAGHYHR